MILPLVVFFVLQVGVKDFHPKAGSPVIGAGVCLPQVTTDHDGNPRPTPGRLSGKGCDIGAYQYVPAGIPDTIPDVPDTHPPQITIKAP